MFMKSADIRKQFIDFFKENGHKEFKTSSLIPDDDSMLFTTAGMVQMVPFLLREKEIEHTRVCSIQKSFRTVDINSIGIDGRHNTFFEMLGSWSFGDYYKKGAIEIAYKLLVDVFKLDKNKLWVSIFKGNSEIPYDSESFAIWRSLGIEEERIVKLGEDNFWGPTSLEGPCGPSTEIYYDLGESIGCGRNTCRPGCDCDRFLEIWNAGVFMEYYKFENGFSKLPYTNVDTGAGLERLALVLQNVTSVFKTDLFLPIVEKIKSSNVKSLNDKSVNIIADHIRGITFLIADGIIPTNEYRGYILRRLIRRAMVQVILMKGEFPYLASIAQTVIEEYSYQYPELKKNEKKIIDTINKEEQLFQKTLRKGFAILDILYDKTKSTNTRKFVSGENMFLLHDTYGLSIDLLEDIIVTSEKDRDIFEKEMKTFNLLLRNQQEKSRMGSSFTVGKSMEQELLDIPRTQFVGFDTLETAPSRVLYVLDMGEDVQFVLDKTPFFAESGGQIGDSGIVLGNNVKIYVENVRKTKNGVFVHQGKYEKNSDKIKENDLLECMVDSTKRLKASNNHTATHLLGKAIKIVLGGSVVQKGSLITPDQIRFDFNFEKPLSDDEIQKIEDIVNGEIKKNSKIIIENITYKDAKDRNIDLPFDDRYSRDEKLRLVKIGDFSEELCGGTHKGTIGNFGKFKIIKQESVGKGVRRVRANLSK